ncbi:MAG: PAS domain-containing sensor histidine kinase [Candidatus Methanofastidiosa archaeon]|jgi:PAS domain S-box-containing protein|nr:PAS domain-containing sensor histidine kinase [Candidatus Methanofastidiosa archaeon]
MEGNKNTERTGRNNGKYIEFESDNNSVYAYPNLSINKDGIIVYANGDISRILGYTRKELIGMEATNIYINPLDRKKLLKELYSKGSIQDYCVTLKRKDGKKVHCELEMSIFKDSEGSILGHTGVLKDIKLETDLRLRLEKENQRLFSVLEKLPVYVCLYNEKREIVFANKCLRSRFHKFKYKKCYEIFYGRNEPCEKCPVLKVFDTGSPKVLECTQIDGRTYEIHDYPFSDIEGNKLVLELGIDITEKVKIEKNLKLVNENLDIVNKVLRHDIINDLTIALNYCNLLKTDDEDTKNKLASSLIKCVDIVEKTRELEKVLNRQIYPTEIQLFDIKTKIAELVRNYPEITFSTLGKCKISVDESISTVFDNIIRNAKIHGKATKIDITLKREKDNCEVWISDNGIGIPNEYKKKVFEEGFSKGLNKGSGIGLYISRKIIERHNGEIEVIDNKPKGSIFILKFKTEDKQEIC